MKDIDGLEEAIAILKPKWPLIEKHFNEENEKYIRLASADETLLGRVLKCHLIIEHYLDRYISSRYNISNLDDLRLSFHQKQKMLPDVGSPAAVIKPGIAELNKIRNRYANNISTTVNRDEIPLIDFVLGIARAETPFPTLLGAIEAFTTIACTWLLVAPPELEEAFRIAFQNVKPGKVEVTKF